MNLPTTIEGKRLFFSEGIQLSTQQFLEILQIKQSEFIIHILTKNITFSADCSVWKTQFSKMHGIFILDSVPFTFTDDKNTPTIGSLIANSPDPLDTGKEKENGTMNYVDEALFRKIGESIFGDLSHRPKQKESIIQDEKPSIPITSHPNLDPNVNQILALRKKIALIQARLDSEQPAFEIRRDLEEEMENLRLKILSIISDPNLTVD